MSRGVSPLFDHRPVQGMIPAAPNFACRFTLEVGPLRSRVAIEGCIHTRMCCNDIYTSLQHMRAMNVYLKLYYKMEVW